MSDIRSILGPTFDPGILQGNRLIHDLPFADYQKLPGVNASLLKNSTAYEMLEYAVGMAALDEHERAVAELTGSNVGDVLDRVEMCRPRTVPVRMVALKDADLPKLSPAQQAAVDAMRNGPVDSRQFSGATLTALDSKGLLEWSTQEIVTSPAVENVSESRAMSLAIGDATHKAILEPHMFDEDTWEQHWQLSPTSSLTSKAALEAAASDPRTLITSEIVDTARRCRDAVWKHRFAAELLRDGHSEVTGQAWDEEAGCWRKIRIDRLPRDPSKGLIDVKTTHFGLQLHQLRSVIYKFGYHLQGALYGDTLGMIEGKPREHFHIIFVTKQAPFLCRCVELNTAPLEDNFIVRGRDLYMERMAMFAEGFLTGKFSAYEHEGLTTLKA